MNNFKKKRGYLYNLRYEMEVASLFNTCIVSSCEEKLFRLKKRKAVRDAKSAVASILLLKEEEFPVVLFMMLSMKNTSPSSAPLQMSNVFLDSFPKGIADVLRRAAEVGDSGCE